MEQPAIIRPTSLSGRPCIYRPDIDDELPSDGVPSSEPETEDCIADPTILPSSYEDYSYPQQPLNQPYRTLISSDIQLQNSHTSPPLIFTQISSTEEY